MSTYGELTYDSVVFKASHNSYDRDEKIEYQLDYCPDGKKYNCGCRSIELDIWRHSSSEMNPHYFSVDHNSGDSGKNLCEYFSKLLKWHDGNKNHDPILVLLDIKSEDGNYSCFPKEIDSYLIKYFGMNMYFNPIMLIKNDEKSLVRSVIKYGWPKIKEIQNKFIFCLSGNSIWKQYYANTNLEHGILFSDYDIPDDDSGYMPPNDGNVVFFNMHICNDHYDKWGEVVPRFKGKHFIFRTYVADNESNWSHSIDVGVSAIATNKISDHKWAFVDNGDPFGIRR